MVQTGLFLTGTLLLIVSVLLAESVARARWARIITWPYDDKGGVNEWDPLSRELGAQIFSSQDLTFIESEASDKFNRIFREERTTLALAWLLQLRKEVDSLMRTHLKVARVSPNLRVVDELKLAGEYCLFTLANRALFCAVCLQGPTAAAALVVYSSRLASELRRVTEILPAAYSVAVELMNDDSEHHHRNVTT